MISVLGSKEKICIEFKYVIRFKLLIINILYYYYTYYSLPNYLFKLKSIINNSISPPQKLFAITKAYFAIRFPYLRITLPHLSKDDLCQEKSHTLLEKVNKPFGIWKKLRIFALEHCEDGSWDLPAVSSDASVEAAVRHRGK